MANLSIINGYRLLPLAAGLNYQHGQRRDHAPDGARLADIREWLDGRDVDGLRSGLHRGLRRLLAVLHHGQGETSIEVVQSVFGTNHRPTGQRGFYMHFRVGADCLIPDAFRLTNHSA